MRAPVIRLAFLILPMLGLIAGTVEAGKGPFQPRKPLPEGCEAPRGFYSPPHPPGAPPRRGRGVGKWGGGVVCRPSGTCPDGKACIPVPPPALPNVVLMIPDDLGECHYGFAGECRSVSTGTPVVAPSTPNLDLLAGYGTVFSIAH